MRRLSSSGVTAAGVVAVLALGACGGSGGSSRGHTTVSTPTETAPHIVSTGTQSTTTTTQTGRAPDGGPVPAGTEATSVTFISPTTAFVLGTASCQTHPCSVILRTTDRGGHWVGVPAPRETISYVQGAGLWGLRFADAQHGYAFGQGLWETGNGGQSWQRAMPPAPTVLSLEAVQDRELVAVAQSCRPGQGCGRRLGIYHAAIGGRWDLVASIRTYAGDASIAVHGPDVWVLAGSGIYSSTDGGITFSPERVPGACRTVGTDSITDDGSHVYLLCTGEGFTGHTLKYVYASTGPGAAWRLVGKPPTPGGGGQIEAGSDRAILIASYSAASWLYRSTDGGRTWRTILTEYDGGAGWNDLGFTTPSNAVVVHGPPVRDGGGDGRPGKVLLSSDGGLTWRAASF